MLKFLPNILTFLNLSAGLLAVLVIIQPEHPHKIIIAPALIIAGGVIDFFDGFLARKLKATSEFGKNLDSFADIVTFGVAPIAFVAYLSPFPLLVAAASLAYMLAAAYRLARFNLHAEIDHFHGLPITAAGIILAVAAPYAGALPTKILMLILAVLMVSKKRFRRIIPK